MLEQIKAMFAEQLGISADTITADSAIIEDLGADSLDIMEMLMAMEETFCISVPDEDVPALRTVGAVAEYIESKTKQ